MWPGSKSTTSARPCESAYPCYLCVPFAGTPWCGPTKCIDSFLTAWMRRREGHQLEDDDGYEASTAGESDRKAAAGEWWCR